MIRLAYACGVCALLATPTAFATNYVYTTINPTGETGTSNAFVSEVFGLNDNGELVVSSDQGGMVYQDGVYTPLPSLSGYTVGPEGINDQGTIVGTATDANNNNQGFILKNGSYSLFNVPGNTGYMEARAVSPSGIVSGIFTDAADNQEGYTYDPSTGVFTDINPPGSQITFAQGQNSAGQLVGSGLNSSTGQEWGFVYQNGSYSDFTVDGDPTEARGINDAGVITGHVYAGGAANVTFVGNPSSGYQLLSVPNATETLAEAINNSGQIAGVYVDANNNSFGFLATPVTLPSATTGSGAFAFDVAVTPDNLIYIDPAAASGYTYQTGTGDPNFQSVVLPIGIGDNFFSLSTCSGASLGTVAGGTHYDFGSGGVSCFKVDGIPASAGLDPSDPQAFVTGLTFTAAGDFTGTMTPMTAAAAPEIDPAGTFGALTLLAGLLAVARAGWAAARTRCGP